VLRTIRKLVKRGKKALREKRRDSRWSRLVSAGRKLLATHDYDKVSVSMITAEVGCSVGAFYGRFTDKDTFLRFLISMTFDTSIRAADRDLGADHWRGTSGATVAGAIVRHVVGQARGENAGVWRAAVKLGRTDPRRRERSFPIGTRLRKKPRCCFLIIWPKGAVPKNQSTRRCKSCMEPSWMWSCTNRAPCSLMVTP